MSRLIFEGDTTKRFGERFPRPFIEQVRAYDNGVEVDIAFYFKVPNEQNKVDAFIEDLKGGALSQSIVLSAINENTLEKLKIDKNFNFLSEKQLEQASNSEQILGQFLRTKKILFSDFVNGNKNPPPSSSNESPNGGITANVDFGINNATPSLSSYNVAIKDDFYSLEGQRFIKIFGTLVSDYNSSGEMYITCFVKNN